MDTQDKFSEGSFKIFKNVLSIIYKIQSTIAENGVHQCLPGVDSSGDFPTHPVGDAE